MNKARYIREITKRLSLIYEQIKAGQQADDINLHRVEGFMNAGIFLGLLSRQELAELIEKIHKDVLGMSVEERRKKNLCRWRQQVTDYSSYETPSYERNSRRSGMGISLNPEK